MVKKLRPSRRNGKARFGSSNGSLMDNDKPRKGPQKFRWKKKGLSDIVGSILMMGITVTVVSTMGLWLMSNPPTFKTVTYAEFSVSYHDDMIKLTHLEGEELYGEEVKILLSEGDVVKKSLNLSDGGVDDNIFSINDEWNFNYSSPIDRDLSIMIKDFTKNMILYQEILFRAVGGPGYLDLKISDQDITFSDPEPAMGQTIFVNATVHNTGIVNASNVIVRLFSSNVYLERKMLANVEFNNSAVASFSFTPPNRGIHTLNVKVSPLENEAHFHNNYASVQLSVETSVRILFTDPNPYINDEDISFSNFYPVHGETIKVYATVSNSGSEACDVKVLFYDGVPDPDNIIDTENVKISGGGQSPTFIYWTNTQGRSHTITVVIDEVDPVDANPFDNEASRDLTIVPTILVVNDDNSPEDGRYEDSFSRITDSLTSCGFPYQEVYVAQGDDGPDYYSGLRPLKDYDIVIWITGFETTSTLTVSDIDNLETYLDNGGYLWLLSYGVLNDLGGGHPFVRNYLKVSGVLGSDNPLAEINGTPGNSYTYDYNYTTEPLPSPLYDGLDYFSADAPAEPMFYSPSDGRNHSVMYFDPLAESKMVFMSWDFTPINKPNDRSNLTYHVLNWFSAALGGSGLDVAISNLEMSSHFPRYMETVTISAVIRNNGQTDLDNVTVAFYINDELMGSFPDGKHNPMRLEVSGNGGELVVTKDWIAGIVGDHTVKVVVDPYNEINEISELNNDISYSDIINVDIGVFYNLLLVDDDESVNNGGALYNVSSNMSDALDRLDYVFDEITVQKDADGPNVTTLKHYNAVIWLTGESVLNTLTVSDQENITKYIRGDYEEASYLSNLHVNAWITGQGILNDLGGAGIDVVTGAGSFLRDVLGVETYSTEIGMPAVIRGKYGDAITHGSEYPTSLLFGDGTDFVEPTSEGVQMFSPSPIGVRVDHEDYNLIFQPWEFSLIRDTRETTRSISEPETRTTLTDTNARYSRGATRAPVVIFSDDMESGRNGWTKNGLWHQSDLRSSSAITSWYYGSEATITYDTGRQNQGSLVSPEISLVGKANCTLSFDHWLETEENPPFDTGYVEINNGKGRWQKLVSFSNAPKLWLSETDIDISFFSGEPAVNIRFRFDTIDAQSNDFEGWYIDNVVIKGDIINAPPELSSIYVSPSIGTPSTEFTFSLIYTDFDNDAPLEAFIFIDDEPHIMGTVDPVFSDGAQFSYSTNLDVGIHSYYFQFRDNTYTVQAPEVGNYQGPIVSSSGFASDVAFYKAEYAYLIMDWFQYPDFTVEFRTSKVDISLSDDFPMIGRAFILRTKVFNHGNTASNVVVRFMDSSIVIGTKSVYIEAGGQSTVEIVWTPQSTGNRILTVVADPDELIDEVFDFNNVALSTDNYVSFFHDDMEGDFTTGWQHDSTVVNINGESALDYLTSSNTNITDDWDWDSSDPAWVLNSNEYHSLNQSFFISEPGGDEATGEADVILAIVLDDSASMSDRVDGVGVSWLDRAKEASKEFVNQISDRSLVSIWHFKGNNEERALPLTSLEGAGRQNVLDAIDGLSNPSGTTILWDATGNAYLEIKAATAAYPSYTPALVVLSDGCDAQASDRSALNNQKVEAGSDLWCPWSDLSAGELDFTGDSLHLGKYTLDWSDPAGSTKWLDIGSTGGSKDYTRTGLLNADIAIYSIGLGLEHHDPPNVPAIAVWPGHGVVDLVNAYCSDGVCLESGTLEYNLWRLSETSDGGEYFFAPTPEELSGIFTQIIQQLTSLASRDGSAQGTRVTPWYGEFEDTFSNEGWVVNEQDTAWEPGISSGGSWLDLFRDLEAHWPMEGNGNDASGNGNHLSGSGGPNWQAGRKNQAVSLDGSDDRLSRNYDNDFNFGSGSFSLSGWFRTDGPAAGAGAITEEVRVSQDADDSEERISNGANDINNNELHLSRRRYSGSYWSNMVGMRFQNVQVPQGATISNAYVEFTCSDADSSGASVSIIGHDTNDANQFSTANRDISNRPDTAASVSWNNIPAWSSGTKYQTPDISTIIQEIVDRGGWNGGQDMAIIINGGSSGRRQAESYRGSAANAPLLHIEYQGGAAGTPQYILSRYDNDQGFKVWMEDDGKISFGIDDDGSWGPDDDVTSTLSYDDDQWHFYSAVKDETNAIRLYIDGNLVDTNNNIIGGSLTSNSADLSLGTDEPGRSDYFNGELDETMVFSRALNGDDVRELFMYADLQGHWKLDDGAGNAAQDSSGNSNDGSLNGPPSWTTGARDGCLDFDGNNDNVQIGDDATLDITGEITLSAWIKIDNDEENRRMRIVNKKQNQNDGDGYELCYDPQDEELVLVGGGNDLGVGIIDLDQEWHHVAGVIDGTTATLYADGVDVTTDPSVSSLSANGRSFYIGARKGDSDEFRGLIDDVRVYARSLTQTEIDILTKSTPDVLVGHWKLDETSGNNVADSSTFGNDGNRQNMEDGDWQDEIIKGSLNFDRGGDEYVVVPHHSSLNLNQFTMMTWINPSSMGHEYQAVISKDIDPRPPSIWLNYDDVEIWWGNGAGGEQLTSNGNLPAANRWYHLAVTYDGANLRLYIDGSLDRSVGRGAPPTNNKDLYFGTRGDSNNWDLDGKMDDIRLYNVPLSSADIYDLYFSSGHIRRSWDRSHGGDASCLFTWNAADDYIEHAESLADTTSASLDFWYYSYSGTYALEGGDQVGIQLSNDGGGSWSALDPINHDNDNNWHRKTVAIPAPYRVANFRYRFVAVSQLEQGDALLLDDFELTSVGANSPPNPASNPEPTDGALEIVINPDLSWTCTDPEGDPITYDVYFGLDPAAGPAELRSNDQPGTTWDPGYLEPYETYYWKIIAEDDNGGTSESPVWSFSTGHLAGPVDGPGGDEDPGDDFTSPDPDLDWNNLTSPAFSINGSSTAHLTFYHKYNLRIGLNGGVILIGREEAGVYKYYYVIPNQQYTSNLYLGSDGSGDSLPKDDDENVITYGYNGVSGNGLFTWDYVKVDLISEGRRLGVDFTNSLIKVRFGYYYFGAGKDGGWWVDDVKVIVTSESVSSQSKDVWQVVETFAHSGSKAWWNGNISNPRALKEGIDNSLYTPSIDLTNALTAEFRGYFKFNINPEPNLPPDGFRVEISADGGVTWKGVNKGSRSSAGISGSNTSASQTETGVSQESTFWIPADSLSRLEVSLDPWIGKVIKIRFRVVTNYDPDYIHFDDSSPETWGGIYIDDIQILGQSGLGGLDIRSSDIFSNGRSIASDGDGIVLLSNGDEIESKTGVFRSDNVKISNGQTEPIASNEIKAQSSKESNISSYSPGFPILVFLILLLLLKVFLLGPKKQKRRLDGPLENNKGGCAC